MAATCNAMRSCAWLAGCSCAAGISCRSGAPVILHLATTLPTIDSCTSATTPLARSRRDNGVPTREIFSLPRATSSRYGNRIPDLCALARAPEFPLIGARAGPSAVRLRPTIMSESCELSMLHGRSWFWIGVGASHVSGRQCGRKHVGAIPARRLAGLSKIHHPER
jgi:hypothetical protein